MGIIGPAIGLATSVCNLIGTEEAMKYISELKSLQDELAAEEQKGDDADDGKIESIHQRIGTTLQAVNSQNALSKSNPSIIPSASK